MSCVHLSLEANGHRSEVERSYTHIHTPRPRARSEELLFVCLFVCLPVSWLWDRGAIGLLFFVFFCFCRRGEW